MCWQSASYRITNSHGMQCTKRFGEPVVLTLPTEHAQQDYSILFWARFSRVKVMLVAEQLCTN